MSHSEKILVQPIAAKHHISISQTIERQSQLTAVLLATRLEETALALVCQHS